MLSAADVRRIGSTTEVLHVRGHLLPLFDLGAQLGFRPCGTAGADRIAILTASEDGSRAALVVDAIVEQRQVVIKGLDRHYGRTPGVAAATILGDGQVALILDPSDLTRPRSGGMAIPFPLAG
ncbi:chemotaxis protein CheW [Paracoccus sp. Z118]|uniref:chemotaxis protein CheW n=1 Tax=Paracoccus sp. Z118 TaxID=2851017 RepID=UPI0035301CF8